MNILIDIGTKLTKVGYAFESEPRKIIFTPEFFDYSKMLNDDFIIYEKYYKEEGNNESVNNIKLYYILSLGT
jgi:hypothetical protein